PEHFPSLSMGAPATTAEQLAAIVRGWVSARIKDSAPDGPAQLYCELLRAIEPVVLEEVMRQVQGNRWVAAQWLGLNRATVRKKLALYDLTAVPGQDKGPKEVFP